MGRVLRRVLLCVAVVVLVAGCQGSSRYDNLNVPPQYQSGAQIRDALVRAGLGCEDFQAVDDAQRDVGEKDAREVDTCRVGNMNAAIMIWLKLGEAQDWARSHQEMGCQLAQSVGTGEPIYVDGGRWTVAVASRPVANKIADALGGQAKFPDCSSVS